MRPAATPCTTPGRRPTATHATPRSSSSRKPASSKWTTVGGGAPRGGPADPAKLAASAPAWLKVDADDLARQRAELEADRAAAAAARQAAAATRGAAAAASLARARAAKTAHESVRRAGAIAAAARADAAARSALASGGGGGRPDFAAHATGDPQWWAVEIPSGDPRKASSVARWLAAAERRCGRVAPREPGGPDRDRVVETYIPKKKVRAWSFRANKMGTRTVAYKGGCIVFFRAVMDQSLGEYVSSGIIDMTVYNERAETGGRVTGYARREPLGGKNQIPLPCTDADLEDARLWEATPEVWDRAASWEADNGADPLPPLADGAGAGGASAPPSPSLPSIRGRARDVARALAESEPARAASFGERVAAAAAASAAAAATTAAAGWNTGPAPIVAEPYRGPRGGDDYGDSYGGGAYAPRGGGRGRGGGTRDPAGFRDGGRGRGRPRDDPPPPTPSAGWAVAGPDDDLLAWTAAGGDAANAIAGDLWAAALGPPGADDWGGIAAAPNDAGGAAVRDFYESDAAGSDAASGWAASDPLPAAADWFDDAVPEDGSDGE